MSNIQKPDTEITDIIGFIQKGGNVKPFLKDIFLITVHVAGLDYIDNIDEIFPKIKVGDKLGLFREATNEYDKHAILVKYHGEKIGYVANSEYTLMKCANSASKIKNKISKDSKAEILFIYLDQYVVAKLI